MKVKFRLFASSLCVFFLVINLSVAVKANGVMSEDSIVTIKSSNLTREDLKEFGIEVEELQINKSKSTDNVVVYAAPRQFTTSQSFRGPDNTRVSVNFTAFAEIQVVRIAGNSYDMFIKVNSVIKYPPTGPFTMINGTENFQIRNGGMSLVYTGSFVLQYGMSVSTGAGISIPPFSFSFSSGTTSYFRGPVEYFTATWNLPGLSIIQ